MAVRKVVSSAANPRKKVRWEAMWYANGKQVTRRFDTRAEAVACEGRMVGSLGDGTYISPRDGQALFGDYAAHYLTHSRAGEGTLELYRCHLRRHILPVFGHRQLAAVRRSDVVAFISRLEQSLAPRTTETVYKLLGSIFRSAVHDRLIPASPCYKVALPHPEPARIHVLTASEVHRLLDAVDPIGRAVIAAGVGLGLRQGEAFGLRRHRITWLGTPQVAVEEQVKTVIGAPPHLAPLKTRASRRLVPMPTLVADAIAAHLTMFPSDDLVFTNGRGGLWRRGSFNAGIWKPALDRAGLPHHLGFHTLRHTYATALIAQGVHPRVIMARLGHTSIQETMNTYGHLFPDAAEETIAAVDRLFAAPADRASDPAAAVDITA